MILKYKTHSYYKNHDFWFYIQINQNNKNPLCIQIYKFIFDEFHLIDFYPVSIITTKIFNEGS